MGDNGGKIIIMNAFSGSGLALGAFSNLLQVTELLSGTAETGNQVWRLQSQGFLRWHGAACSPK